jgi:hypothetical protein
MTPLALAAPASVEAADWIDIDIIFTDLKGKYGVYSPTQIVSGYTCLR